MVETLLIGPIQTIKSGVIYALPARRCAIFSDSGLEMTHTLEPPVTWVALAPGELGAAVRFIRSTGPTQRISLTAMA